MEVAKRQVALVTGASSGMGKDFALRLIAEGYTVYGAARRTGHMTEIEAAGGRVICLDVADDASIVNCVEQIIREQGHIDILINNAGYGQFGALEDVPPSEALRQIEVNLLGPARLTQLCLPHMRARKFGKIFNITSIGGKLATPLGGWYHASKYALEGYSDSLRNEVRRFGIDVVVIEPGGIETEWAGIASDEASRYSGHGAYADFVDKFRSGQERLGKNPPPKVISDLIIKALKAKRPAARYHGGRLAGPLLFLRNVLSDRMLDKVIMSAFR
ncbi:oxidoreductase [Burkholderia gladioli]|uniref:oxidoreductase n=1 Tax=Burkholderia gladioli TaxID=28095 RepID=UPI001640DE08|nr:oxidoreductase [Burkholderia gladioli]